jgi:hypothetical protein
MLPGKPSRTLETKKQYIKPILGIGAISGEAWKAVLANSL